MEKNIEIKEFLRFVLEFFNMYIAKMYGIHRVFVRLQSCLFIL